MYKYLHLIYMRWKSLKAITLYLNKKVGQMEKKLTSRDKQAIETKNKIFKTGIDLIRDYGIDSITINQITKKANVSVGTFYHYYTSKLDLFMDLYRSADKYYEDEISQKVKGLPYKEQVKLFFREYALIAEKNGIELTRKMYVADNELFISREEGMHRVLLDIVSAAKNAGLIKNTINEKTPAEIKDELFLIARGTIFDWALNKGSYSLTDKMDSLLDIYL